jgi:hypothetical protein
MSKEHELLAAALLPLVSNLSPEEMAKLLEESHDKTIASYLEASGEMESGMGTPVAEYGEDGPYHCINCWYLASAEPRGEPLGRCNESHMLKDPKVKKDEQGMAIVNKMLGCCRFVDPIKCEGADKDFVFAKDSKEEEKEHQA